VLHPIRLRWRSGERKTCQKYFGLLKTKMKDAPILLIECIEYNQSAAQLHTMLREAEFNALWSEGISMTMSR
jgi:hypothetical protein